MISFIRLKRVCLPPFGAPDSPRAPAVHTAVDRQAGLPGHLFAARRRRRQRQRPIDRRHCVHVHVHVCRRRRRFGRRHIQISRGYVLSVMSVCVLHYNNVSIVDRYGYVLPGGKLVGPLILLLNFRQYLGLHR